MKGQIYLATKNARKVRRSLDPNMVAIRLRTRSLVNDMELDCQHSPWPSTSKEFEGPEVNPNVKQINMIMKGYQVLGDVRNLTL
ncbi:hypothetical protein Goshw_022966 [Gossypium schwendimanii]|uniref:Uncharacterized protein n=1 Tax=Gossypium schwendimanii TaxID=34291 RepID=A0A7J9LXX6_GOSSC|nr:hypothetical protein [Gossypium schwendimanii]